MLPNKTIRNNILLLLITVFIYSFAYAQSINQTSLRNTYFTGQVLLDDLQATDDKNRITDFNLLKFATATGYLVAIFDTENYSRWNTLLSLSEMQKKDRKTKLDDASKLALANTFICPPYQVTNSQLQTIVIKHLKENQASLNGRSDLLVKSAFKEAFPCKVSDLFAN